MRSQMNHRERVLAARDGDEFDRPPVSMWRHYFLQERNAEDLTAAMLAHQARYDWDFMKVNPRASYHSEPWGVQVHYAGDLSPETVSVPVKREADWSVIQRIRMDHPVFREQITALEGIARGLKGSVPYLATVFTPVSIASRLAARSDEGLVPFMEQLRAGSERLRGALEAITETFADFSRTALDLGAAGLFYATTAFATRDRMTQQEYRELVRPWDLKLLNALPEHDLTILHVCRDNIFLDEFADYPVHAVNWDVPAGGNPGMAEGRHLLGAKAVVGGLGRARHLFEASPAQIYGTVAGLKAGLGKRGWMVGPACTYDPGVPDINIAAVRMGVETG